MYSVIVSRSTRMELFHCVRQSLAARGYVEMERVAGGTSIAFDMWAEGDRVACALWVGGVDGRALDALAELGVDAEAICVEVIGQRVTFAEHQKLSGGEQIECHDLEETAQEIAEDWADGGHIDEESEASLCFALLELPHRRTLPEHERFELWRDPKKPLPEPPPPPPPGPWRRFQHGDGRKWSVRVRHDGYDLEIVDSDGDVVVARSRQSARPAEDVRVLAFEQTSDGFVEE